MELISRKTETLTIGYQGLASGASESAKESNKQKSKAAASDPKVATPDTKDEAGVSKLGAYLAEAAGIKSEQENTANTELGPGPKLAANKGGERQSTQQLSSNGELDLSMLLGFYTGNEGDGKANFILSKSAFNGFVNEMTKDGRIHLDQGRPVPSVKDLYQVPVSAYGTPYENAVGTGTLYYNSTGIVGYSDYWNFDHKPSGGRSLWGEAKTWIGSAIPGSPFYVLYGIRPTDNNIPHD